MEAAPPVKSGKQKKRKVTHIHIRKAGNGYTVHHELEPMPRKAGPALGFGGYEPDPDPNVFNDKQAMLNHVSSLSDQMGGDQPGAPSPDGGAQTQPA